MGVSRVSEPKRRIVNRRPGTQADALYCGFRSQDDNNRRAHDVYWNALNRSRLHWEPGRALGQPGAISVNIGRCFRFRTQPACPPGIIEAAERLEAFTSI